MPDDAMMQLMEIARIRDRIGPALALLLVFLVGVRGLVYRLRVGFGDVEGSLLDDRVTQIVFYCVYGFVILALARSGGALLRLRTMRVLGVLLGVLLVSTAWSIEWGRTLNQSLLFLLGTLAVASAAHRLQPRDVVVVLVATTQIVMWWSVFAAARDWSFAFDRHDHLAGILYNRNALGAVCALGVLAAAALGWEFRASRRAVVMASALGLVGAILWWRSGSVTSFLAAGAGIVAGVWVVAETRTSGRARRLVRCSPFVAGGAVILAVVFRGTVTSWMGRDATFTGRTSTWGYLIDTWAKRPIAGFGFFAGWFDPGLRAGVRSIGYNHWEAHNGYLEVLLGAGVIGAALLAWFLLESCRAVVRLRHEEFGPWAFAALVFVLVVNLGETNIAAHRLPWFLLIAVLVSATSHRASRAAD